MSLSADDVEMNGNKVTLISLETGVLIVVVGLIRSVDVDVVVDVSLIVCEPSIRFDALSSIIVTWVPFFISSDDVVSATLRKTANYWNWLTELV